MGDFLKKKTSPPSPSLPDRCMAKTRGGHSSSYRLHVQPSSPPPIDAAPPPAGPPTTDPAVAPAADMATYATAAVAVQGVHTLTPAAPAPRRHDTWVGPTPPSPPHPRPSRRAPPPKRAWTSCPGESSNSWAQDP